MIGKSRVERQWNVGKVLVRDLDRAVYGGAAISVSASSLKDTSKIHSALRAQWTGNLEKVYRVNLGDSVEVMCMGIDSIDTEAEGVYADMSELPEWIQERIAVLSMMKVNPPQTKIEGVGMRIDENVYWVIKGD